jgi:hypothetical protein
MNSAALRAARRNAPRICRPYKTCIASGKYWNARIWLRHVADQRYRSSFNVFNLIKAANAELREQEPELFKIFCLASMAGLRRAEIDLLEWSAFRWDEGVIRIEPTKFFQPKTEDSIGDVEIDHELLELFRELKTRTLSNFVIQSPFACSAQTGGQPSSTTYAPPCSSD